MKKQSYIVGKADVSNLADYILQKINVSIETAVQKTVNGKLDDIKANLIKQDSCLEKIGNQFDDHAIHAQACRTWLISDEGLEMMKAV